MNADDSRPTDESLRALADAAAAIVSRDDLTDVLATLLVDCVQSVGAESGGLLALGASHELELLSATSHSTEDLELFQLELSEGPCVDAVRTAAETSAASGADMTSRWPRFAQHASALGVQAVHAMPMIWHGHVIGCLNIFSTHEGNFDESERLVVRAFADIATIAIISRDDLTSADIIARTERALEGRTLIEQAKGVLAYQHDLDMGRAYETLLTEASAAGRSLTVQAAHVIERARRRATPQPPR
jgi:GAF domain-containing protein